MCCTIGGMCLGGKLCSTVGSVCPCKPVVGTCIRTRIHDLLVSQQPGSRLYM